MFYWDPKPEIFHIPLIGFPILWYGALFALGFYLGFLVSATILRRFLLNDPEYIESDILKPKSLSFWGKNPKEIAKSLNGEIRKGAPKKLPEKFKKVLDKCLEPKRVAVRLYLDLELGDSVLGVLKKGLQIADKVVLYVLVATIVGARVGHFLFYESPSDYFQDPFQIFRVWEGGLASHGAAIGIIIALYLLSRKLRKIDPKITWLRVLDFMAPPTSLCGCFIRLGNFFNQEILGTPTTMFWGVVFGHPSGGPRGIPLHPVQLYEAVYYLLVFFLLYRLSYLPKYLFKEGKLCGLFFLLVFGFRFFIEFIKFEQSQIFSATLNMGQVLSIPMILLGLVFFFWKKFRG